MFRVDLHAHSHFFHGYRRLAAAADVPGVRLLAAAAAARGLDAVAVTNHNYCAPVPDSVAGVRLLPGVEVSTTRGHVLVVGPDPPRETTPGTLTPGEVASLAHDRGCAAVVAHPYRDSTVRQTDAAVDALEVNGKHPRTGPAVEQLAERLGLPIVGGSDAHYPVEVGNLYTRVAADSLTPTGVADAIRAGDVEPAVRGGRFARLVRRAYRARHDHLDRVHVPDDYSSDDNTWGRG